MKYAQKLYGPMITGASPQDMASAMAMYPMMKPALEKMAAEGSKMQGTPILTTTTMDAVKSAEQMAAEKEQAASETKSAPTSSAADRCRRPDWRLRAPDGAKEERAMTPLRRRAQRPGHRHDDDQRSAEGRHDRRRRGRGDSCRLQREQVATARRSQGKRPAARPSSPRLSNQARDSGSPTDISTLRLTDRVRRGVRVLFVGINPGVRSAVTNHHFAGHSNRFWKLLFDAGLVPEPITYIDDDRLPEWGFGVTNLIPRPTPGNRHARTGRLHSRPCRAPS